MPHNVTVTDYEFSEEKKNGNCWLYVAPYDPVCITVYRGIVVDTVSGKGAPKMSHYSVIIDVMLDQLPAKVSRNARAVIGVASFRCSAAPLSGVAGPLAVGARKWGVSSRRIRWRLEVAIAFVEGQTTHTYTQSTCTRGTPENEEIQNKQATPQTYFI